jgi:hypothetical protein
MAVPEMNLQNMLIGLAIQEAPAVIDRIKELFHRDNPDAPQPTSEDVIAAYQSAFDSSLAKDDRWLAAHPDAG